MKLYVILASHNRCQTTLTALRALYSAARFAGVDIKATLFDDKSTDQTVNSVADEFPDVSIIHGDGKAYWARSMYLAEKHILQDPNVRDAHDYVVWLNDDVVLDADALGRLLHVAESHPAAVIVCATRDPSDGTTTYSGFERRGRHPLRLQLLEPSDDVTQADTFNGNLVLVPLIVARKLKNIDGDYAHALADIDYGYRANRAGIPVLLAPGKFGTCPRNPPREAVDIRSDWKAFIGVKGGAHPTSLLKILRISAPRTFPFYFVATYCLWWLRAFRRLATSLRK